MSKKLIEGIDYYFNEDGLMVFVQKYHLERGYCCGNGCLHCPFRFVEGSEEREINLKIIGDEKNKRN